MQLSVQEDLIDFTEFRFDIGDGDCKLEQGQVALDGLTPEYLILRGLRLERFPLGSTVRHALSPDMLEEVEGHLTTTLRTLTVPFDNFLTMGLRSPLHYVSRWFSSNSNPPQVLKDSDFTEHHRETKWNDAQGSIVKKLVAVQMRFYQLMTSASLSRQWIGVMTSKIRDRLR